MKKDGRFLKYLFKFNSILGNHVAFLGRRATYREPRASILGRPTGSLFLPVFGRFWNLHLPVFLFSYVFHLVLFWVFYFEIGKFPVIFKTSQNF